MDRPFGDYILHERIGIGGMGEVFRATRHGPDGFEVQVALKLILPHLAREEKFRRRFSEEAKLAALLKHPNIVQVNDLKIINEIPVIEMEFLRGSDLRKIIHSLPSGQKLPLDESLAILYSTAKALAHAHGFTVPGTDTTGIIHCDLNPHNILVSKLGETKVADFGIARAIRGDVGASATVRGKLAYMSPEQMDGRNLDHRTDLFSYGIIAYQLLAGRHPFERASEGATIAAVGKADCLPLKDAVPDVPSLLVKLTDDLLNFEPGSRPENAKSILEVLEPHVQPSADSALGDRVRSLEGTDSEKDGSPLINMPTAPTLPQQKKLNFGPYIAAAAAGIAILSGLFFLLAVETPVKQAKPAAAIVRPDPSLKSHTDVEKDPVQVTLESIPPGAGITADGVWLGQTPLTIDRNADGMNSRFTARLYGFRDETFQIPPDTDKQIILTMTPLPTATVRISARPWATVSFRGDVLGETPVAIPDIPFGEHTFLLENTPLEKKKKLVLVVKENMEPVMVDMREGR